MTTGRDLVTLILRRAGAIGGNDTPTADESNDTLEVLNGLIDSWANDSLLVYSRSVEAFPMNGQQQYTVGIGQDLNTVPFVSIVAAYARQGDTDYPLKSLTDEDYARVLTKDERNWPSYYNYNNGYPVGLLKLYPVLDASWTLHIVSEKPLSNLALDDVINLPPGWKRALVNNGAVEICPDYGLEVSPLLDKLARESLGALKNQVSRSRTLDWGTPSPQTGNIYSGWWN